MGQTQKMSGRALRRLPVLALARYIGIGNVAREFSHSSMPNDLESTGSEGAQVEAWLEGMEKVVKEQARELEKMI